MSELSAVMPEQEQLGDGVGVADLGTDSLGPISSATAVPLPALDDERSRALPGHVAKKVIGGTSTLGAGMLIERGTGFLANILAARFGGVQTFGAYSVAISSANQISTYAAGGIGATAARFSGKYQYGTRGYATLARSLAIVSLFSAAAAAAALWLGAVPLAHILKKVELTELLRWAALSAAGIVVLECARGFFVGQRRLLALLMLSLIVGGGMVTLLPAAAKTHSAVRMIVTQGGITTSAVLVCLLFAGPLGLYAATKEKSLPLGPMLREVWSFGLVQLAGLVGANIAGWWLTILVAREDTTLVQMSFFAIASQMRNLVGIAPSLLTEGSYAVMAEPDGEAQKTPHRVMALCSYASISVAMMLAAIGIVVVPWMLTLLYGKTYAPRRDDGSSWARDCRSAHGKCSGCGAPDYRFDQDHRGHQHGLGDLCSGCGESVSPLRRRCLAGHGDLFRGSCALLDPGALDFEEEGPRSGRHVTVVQLRHCVLRVVGPLGVHSNDPSPGRSSGDRTHGADGRWFNTGTSPLWQALWLDAVRRGVRKANQQRACAASVETASCMSSC